MKIFQQFCTLGCFLLPIALVYLKFHLEILFCIWMNFFAVKKILRIRTCLDIR